jgi:hypothetical protein
MSWSESELHVMEITPIPDEPFHLLGSPCWCQPTVEDVLPSGRLVIHRRTLDSPRYESDPPADFGEQYIQGGPELSARIHRDLERDK